METIRIIWNIKKEMKEILYKIELIDYYEDYDKYIRCVFDKMEKIDNKIFIATIEYYTEEFIKGHEDHTMYEIEIIKVYQNKIGLVIKKPENSKGDDDLIIKLITEIIS